MKLLNEVEPEVKVVVKQIDGGSEVKGNLADLGISEGTELTVVATEPVHVHAGPIALNVAAGREVVLARGWADKVYVEKGGETLPLLRLENGDKCTVKTLEGGKTFEDNFSELDTAIEMALDAMHRWEEKIIALKGLKESNTQSLEYQDEPVADEVEVESL